MNRAARIADKATCGQVWCTRSAWDAITFEAAKQAVDLAVEAVVVGTFALKGVPDSVEVMQCSPAQRISALEDVHADVWP